MKGKVGKALQKLQKLRIMLENVTIMQIFPKDGIFCYNKKVKYKELWESFGKQNCHM